MPPEFLDTFFPTRPAEERLRLLVKLYLRSEADNRFLQDVTERQAIDQAALRAAADASLQIPVASAILEQIAAVKAHRESQLAQLHLSMRRLELSRPPAAVRRALDWLWARTTPEGMEAWHDAGHGPLITEEELLAELSLALGAAGQPAETDAGLRSDRRSPTAARGS